MNASTRAVVGESFRDRIEAITGSEESDLRSRLARYLAFQTDFSVAECLDVLRRSPVDQARAADIAAHFGARSPTFMNDARSEEPAPFEAACHHPPSH